MANTAAEAAVPNATGRVLHWAFGYDLLAWAFCLGRERAFRERLLDLAELKIGEQVLDVGCGTGTLAIAAKRRVGPKGCVCGIDASPEMIARAAKKAKTKGADVRFEKAIVQKLPFADGTFDVALSTLMLHHLGRQARQQCLSEIRRVLKPGGRLLAVDFSEPPRSGRGLFDHFPRHGHLKFSDLKTLLTEAGFPAVEMGAVGARNLHYASAGVPCSA